MSRRRFFPIISGFIFCVALAGACDGGHRGDGSALTVTEIATETMPPAGVRVIFSLHNKSGEPVDGLVAENISILADGRPLLAEGVPTPVLMADPGTEHFVMILLDLSTGMASSGSLGVQLDAALELANTLVPENRVAIAIYAGPTHFSVEVPFTESMTPIEAVVGPAGSLRDSEGLGTRDLYGAIWWALGELSAMEGSGVTARTLVFFAGGEDQALSLTEEAAAEHVREASEAGTNILALGLREQVERSMFIPLAPSGFEIVADGEDLVAAALRIAFEVGQITSGNYLLAICSPRVGGERTLTLNLSRGDADGTLEVTYSADGFDMAGCDPETVADPCQGQECGMVMGRSCGTCSGTTPYCNSQWHCSPTPSCPGDMVMIALQNVCIDRYEASRGYGRYPESVPGVRPWANVSWIAAQDACASVGKRLCTEEEWTTGCSGTTETRFPYGDVCRPGDCNATSSGAEGSLPTGTLVECEGGYPGLFDMSGNLREWLDACEGTLCQAVGGSYTDDDCLMTCSSATDVNRNIGDQALGFRCCMSL